MPLEDIDTNGTMSGVIVTVTRVGVFVDVGAERDGLLGCRSSLWRSFWPGDRLGGLTVEKLDLDKRQFVLHCDDPASEIERNRQPLAKFKPGSVVPGVVQGRHFQYGLFINVHAEITGRLMLPRKRDSRTLFKGTYLSQLRIDSIDPENGKMKLVIDDPAVYENAGLVSIKDMRPIGKAKAPARTRSPQDRVKTRVGERQLTPAPSKGNRRPAAEPSPAPTDARGMRVRVGAVVDGQVIRVTSKGVQVQLSGNGALCPLLVSPELRKEFQKGDQVEGMVVERIKLDGSIVLSMEDPELEVSR